MQRERVLGAGAAVVAALALLVAGAGPGVLDPPEEGPTRPGSLDVVDVTVSHGEVTGRTVALRVEPFLRHRGNPVENVTVLVRAVDGESGMLETTREVGVGRIAGEREVGVPANLTVEREGGYRIEVIVYRDGRRVASDGRVVSGLGSLTPAYARTAVGFEAPGALPAVSTAVREAGPNRTRLAVAAWLTNSGDEPADGLRVTLLLRQADSNLVAAEASTEVGRIAPGRTATADATVSVPAGYNYHVDAVLWKGGVVVDTARSVVNLDPQRRIRANVTTEDVGLEVSDFERTEERPPRPRETAAAAGRQSPGFGVVAGAAALLAAALLARRWER